ncbi:CHRD domain-containing protein [Acidisphaera sp. S103]|uniref:CHRD domain-containing protein n=1 Tax=Acidisphaera sp. S103 TaxID=1747223 RepID=UPI00131C0804|nr:CHRD domain-containing protein [Acidisphaera sp. S103]
MLRASLLATALTLSLATAASAAMLHFTASLDGKTEVPPTKSTGYGDLLATLDTSTKTLNYTLTFGGLTGPATAAHFHGPAAPGANAGVAVAIGKAPTSPVSGKATLTDPQIADLEAGKWYVNVHTAANPGGEIRGQVKPDTMAMPAKSKGKAMAMPATKK